MNDSPLIDTAIDSATVVGDRNQIGEQAPSDGLTDAEEQSLKDALQASSSSSLDETLLLLNRVVHAAATSLVVTDPALPDNPIVFHNPAFERVSGYSASEIDGHNCRFLQGPDSDPATIAEIRNAIAEQRFCHVTLLNYRKDGTPFWNELSVSPVHDADGTVTHFVGVQNDVTRRTEAERERNALLEQQQRIVSTLQKALLLTSPPEFDGLEVAAQYEPASDEAQFGGDFYDVFPLDERRVALVCGDVTGKGVKAAQYIAEVKYGLRILLREHPSDVTTTLERLNQFLMNAQRLDAHDENLLVCIALCVVDTLSGAGQVVSAGMEPPLIVRADGATESIDVTGALLGIDLSSQYVSARIQLGIADALLLTTDGITEARRGRREFFGYDGLTQTACAALTRQGVEYPTLESVAERIVGAAKDFVGGKPQDDVCLLVARRTSASFKADLSMEWGDDESQFSVDKELAALLPSLSVLPPSAPEEQRNDSAHVQEREILRLALEAGRLGLFRRDLITGRMDMTTQCCVNLGLPPNASIRFDDLLTLMPAEDRDAFRSTVERSIREKTDYSAQYRIVFPGKDVRWVAARGRAVYGPDDKPLQMIGVTQDITELRQAEDALRISGATLRTSQATLLHSETAVHEREDRVKSLYSLTSRTDIGFVEKVCGLLRAGREWFGVETGILARIDVDSGIYKATYLDSSHEVLTTDFTCPLEQTFCSIIMQGGAKSPPLAIDHASADDRWRYHAAHTVFG